MYQFKKFENTNARLEDRITLTRSGSIGFPTKFYQDNGIKEFRYVILFFDELKQAVGLQFANNQEEKNKFSIIHNKFGHGGAIVVRSFLKTYNIDPGEYYGRYSWSKENLPDTGELFVIELKKRDTAEEKTGLSASEEAGA